MSTHNICFHREIRKIFTWYPLLSRPMCSWTSPGNGKVITVVVWLYYRCLQSVIQGCGHEFNDYVDQELLDLIFRALTHTNRFVRETGYYVCSSLVSCGLVRDGWYDAYTYLQIREGWGGGGGGGGGDGYQVNFVLISWWKPIVGARQKCLNKVFLMNITTYDAQQTKMALMQFADNSGPNQPAHLCRLIWAFVVRLQNQWLL